MNGELHAKSALSENFVLMAFVESPVCFHLLFLSEECLGMLFFIVFRGNRDEELVSVALFFLLRIGTGVSYLCCDLPFSSSRLQNSGEPNGARYGSETVMIDGRLLNECNGIQVLANRLHF
ncbi:hypothetical protein AVEN_224647-1 [Araneus ventricosus]|uniref:Uncharacterized protein n=1 Tax=Araneus ventricosus TaxID=182803 RepID=A0A4Y2TGM2_ARAVE|nr:hypothetical protein AVEN_224647-1 [Araneus ventricosus]